jgi:hypothetical protein
LQFSAAWENGLKNPNTGGWLQDMALSDEERLNRIDPPTDQGTPAHDEWFQQRSADLSKSSHLSFSELGGQGVHPRKLLASGDCK